MTTPAWTEVAAPRAAEIYQRFAPPDSAHALLEGDPSPAEFFERVLQAHDYAVALPFAAFALPPRQGIWWGCLCLEIARGERLPPSEARALEAAVRWVLEPIEAHRQAARAPAEAAGLATPAGNLAQAVFWSGGSMLPPGEPVIPPPPLLRPQAVRRAISLLASEPGASHRDCVYRQFLMLAAAIARGKHRWPRA